MLIDEMQKFLGNTIVMGLMYIVVCIVRLCPWHSRVLFFFLFVLPFDHCGGIRRRRGCMPLISLDILLNPFYFARVRCVF